MKERRKHTKTDLKALDALIDNDVDYSDVPELDEAFFKKARLSQPSLTAHRIK